MTPISNHKKYLRRYQTDAEKRLWSLLRNRQLGFKFRRQHDIAQRYIVDFICLEKKLIIELDGGQHNEVKDKERTDFLENEGYTILRFWNNNVLKNHEGVVQAILSWLHKSLDN